MARRKAKQEKLHETSRSGTSKTSELTKLKETIATRKKIIAINEAKNTAI